MVVVFSTPQDFVNAFHDCGGPARYTLLRGRHDQLKFLVYRDPQWFRGSDREKATRKWIADCRRELGFIRSFLQLISAPSIYAVYPGFFVDISTLIMTIDAEERRFQSRLGRRASGGGGEGSGRTTDTTPHKTNDNPKMEPLFLPSPVDTEVSVPLPRQQVPNIAGGRIDALDAMRGHQPRDLVRSLQRQRRNEGTLSTRDRRNVNVSRGERSSQGTRGVPKYTVFVEVPPLPYKVAPPPQRDVATTEVSTEEMEHNAMQAMDASQPHHLVRSLQRKRRNEGTLSTRDRRNVNVSRGEGSSQGTRGVLKYTVFVEVPPLPYKVAPATATSPPPKSRRRN
ncbi:hypothetical protein ONZ45_g12412 [Pleurotus djamor]|nr:hypothetical protein ONZ45_g12412 [Pleurotus djamor]